MASVTREIIINETPERLFDYVTNQENLPKWLLQIAKSEVKGGGPIQRGSILIQTLKQGNWSIDSEAEVIKHDRSYSHIVSTRIMGVETTISFDFQAQENDRTKITLISKVRGRGLGVFLVPMVEETMTKSDVYLENLKQLVEINH
ncbi:MAG: SRPBCC family protein [Dehalococcoidia bacterium]|nr:SRPBCC family protein [Dehalococcoidia bacterium]